jgi:pyrroloquinoline-quinone synthase
LTQAPRDADFALRLVVERCQSRELQESAVAALKFKCELLWAMLDAMHLEYVLNRKIK